MILQSTGWVVQAAALDRGSLVVVQSLTALSLVIALPLGALLTNQHIGRRSLGGAVLTVVGIIFFISAGQPQGGTTQPEAAAWWWACVSIGVLVLVLFAVGRRRTGATRALVFGAAAGLGYGLQAAVTKTFVTQIGGGVLVLLGTWTTYVLILSAVSGFILQQSALKTGVLAPAMASSNSVTLFSSVVLGMAVYGETLSRSGTAHTGCTVIGLVIAVVGIALLAGSEEPVEANGPSNRSVAVLSAGAGMTGTPSGTPSANRASRPSMSPSACMRAVVHGDLPAVIGHDPVGLTNLLSFRPHPEGPSASRPTEGTRIGTGLHVRVPTGPAGS